MITLDTHVVVWLHAGELDLFSDLGRLRLDREPAVICPLVALELEYLYEVQRISARRSKDLPTKRMKAFMTKAAIKPQTAPETKTVRILISCSKHMPKRRLCQSSLWPTAGNAKARSRQS